MGAYVFFNYSILHSRIPRAFGPREPRLATTFGYAMHREPPYPLPLIRSKTVGLFGRFLITLFRVQSAFTGCNDTLLREKVVRAVFLTDNHAKVSLGACAYWQDAGQGFLARSLSGESGSAHDSVFPGCAFADKLAAAISASLSKFIESITVRPTCCFLSKSRSEKNLSLS